MKHGAVAAFIRARPKLTPKEIVEAGAKQRLRFKVQRVYAIRAYDATKIPKSPKPPKPPKKKPARKAKTAAARKATFVVSPDDSVIEAHRKLVARAATLNDPRSWEALLRLIAAELGYARTARVLDDWYAAMRDAATVALAPETA